jgi:translin
MVNNMTLEEILSSIRTEIENDDETREKILPLVREAVRKFSQSIKASHRKTFSEAEKILDEGGNLVKKAVQEAKHSEFVRQSKTFNVAYQEMAEAANVLSLLKEGEFASLDKYEIPSQAYLTGLADTVGELRRAALDALRKEKIQRAEQLLQFMEEILEGLQAFDFPNALIPDLRRKCDVARSLIERTRGDLTAAVGQSRLVKELRSFEERIKDTK